MVQGRLEISAEKVGLEVYSKNEARGLQKNEARGLQKNEARGLQKNEARGLQKNEARVSPYTTCVRSTRNN